MKKFVITALAALLVSACVYPYKPELEEKDLEKQLVVDGKILVGGTSTITVNYLQPLNANSTGIPLAEAWIEDSEGHQYKPESGMTRGSYFTIATPEAAADAQYRAVIRCDGETYVSAWLTPDPACSGRPGYAYGAPGQLWFHVRGNLGIPFGLLSGTVY